MHLAYSLALIFFTFITLAACAKAPITQDTQPNLTIVAELEQGPGNVTLDASGQLLVSLHQFYQHDIRVARVHSDNVLQTFAEPAQLNSVLGLQADSNHIVWLLDNAMRNGNTRRLVGWHLTDDQLYADIDLSGVTTERSFLNDLAISTDHHTAYIADPASGSDAAIIVVNLKTGQSRRLLIGHSSVVPEEIDLIIDDNPVRIRTDSGQYIRPRVGINPIALDKNNEWLYYGPMHGYSMYRIHTQHLRNQQLSSEELSNQVEFWSEKPICDGISIDHAGNLYLGDLANNAIGVIGPDRQYRQLISDNRLSWVDAFSFGPDGYLYTVINQLHRSAVLNGGTAATVPPYLIAKFKPLAEGTTGR